MASLCTSRSLAITADMDLLVTPEDRLSCKLLCRRNRESPFLGENLMSIRMKTKRGNDQ